MLDPRPKEVTNLYVNGENQGPGSRLTVWADPGKICVLFRQTLDDGEVNDTLAMPDINEEGMLTKFTITEPRLFTFEVYPGPEEDIDTENEKH